jgi:hypothetical protein
MDQRIMKREGGEDTGEEEDERRDQEPHRQWPDAALPVSPFFTHACVADEES